MVFEPASGGLLTLLAHSAVSDLAQLDATVRVSTATAPGQGTAMLAAEPFWCVVVDLGMPTALEFLDQVREKPELREIPVLAHAAGQQDERVSDCRGAARRLPRRSSCCRRLTTCASGSRCTCPHRGRARCRRWSPTAAPRRAIGRGELADRASRPPRPARQARAGDRRRRAERLRDHQHA